MSEQKPLISVIVPVYNCEPYIEECVESILTQTYPNIEVVLVDDGSKDHSLEKINEIKSKHNNVIVLHQENKGASAARNTGVLAASGIYVGFVDGDDTIEQTMYETLYDELMAHPECTISMVNMHYEYQDGSFGKPIFHFSEGVISAHGQMRLLLMHEGSSSPCNILLPRDFFLQHPFRENISNEDFVFWAELLPSIEAICFKDQCLYNYFVHEGSMTHSGFTKGVHDMVDNTEIAQKIVSEYYPDLQEEMERFWLIQRMYYLQLIPFKGMKPENQHYMNVRNGIRSHQDWIKNNRFLTKKQRLYLKGFCMWTHGMRAVFYVHDSIHDRYKEKT
ncbi:MAG: glycosyltransferase [Bulleidia sp.]|nr:glycosyltransferase [Bulleidia sp.]